MKLRKSKNKKLVKLATEFQPWDFGFNLEIELEMLVRMYSFYSSDKPVAVGSEIIAKEINLAINLLKIIIEEDNAVVWSSKYILTKYVNIKNAKRFGNIPNLDEPLMKECLRRSKAWYLYNKLRLYRMQSWWD